MTCPDCLTALARPHHGLYQSHCQGCLTRLLAASYGRWESIRDGAMSPRYEADLKAAFGDEWEAGAQRVREKAKQLKEKA